MKKKTIIAVILLAAILIAFVPIPTTRTISGDGTVLTSEKAECGTCVLKIEIREVSSLAVCYQRQFSFVLDGIATEPVSGAAYSEADGLCSLAQMYYDQTMNEMALAVLIYPEDLSYVVLDLGDHYYLIDQGADIAYAELPIS